ncbi:hypothetical protein FRB90_009280 [Tulasnella sp. 427]|nr:hypothetical protein FRB90_009280 [Tulasnella sp. 427]
MHNHNITEVPTELQLQIIFYLTPSAIRNLIVNRALRPICEQGLYESISIPKHRERSIRLLETVVARPDLALLIRHLSIDLSWLWSFSYTHVGSPLQPNPLHALSLAKNLKSFAPHGLDDWIWEPMLSELRDAYFGMKLTRLEIPKLRGPYIQVFSWPGDEIPADDWDGDVGQELCKIFQAQPLLEELVLPTSSILGETGDSLQTNLKDSDIPSLKLLQASPDDGPAFLTAALRLETLSLTIGDWNETVFSRLETASTVIRLSLRHFNIRVWLYSDNQTWVWDNLDRVLGLFPNTEGLCITINASSRSDAKNANYHFKKVADNVCVLPALRSVTVKYECPTPLPPGAVNVEDETVEAFKSACPLLQSVIDPMQRLWTFRGDSQSAKELSSHLVGKLIEEYHGFRQDLSAHADGDK